MKTSVLVLSLFLASSSAISLSSYAPTPGAVAKHLKVKVPSTPTHPKVDEKEDKKKAKIVEKTSVDKEHAESIHKETKKIQNKIHKDSSNAKGLEHEHAKASSIAKID